MTIAVPRPTGVTPAVARPAPTSMATEDRGNAVYAGTRSWYASADGNAYRNADGGWQQHGASGWQSASGDTSWADREQQPRSSFQSSGRDGSSWGGAGDDEPPVVRARGLLPATVPCLAGMPIESPPSGPDVAAAPSTVYNPCGRRSVCSSAITTFPHPTRLSRRSACSSKSHRTCQHSRSPCS